MLVIEMVASLRLERDNPDSAICSLERIERGISLHPNRLGSETILRKRGRPRGSKNKVRVAPPTMVTYDLNPVTSPPARYTDPIPCG